MTQTNTSSEYFREVGSEREHPLALITTTDANLPSLFVSEVAPGVALRVTPNSFRCLVRLKSGKWAAPRSAEYSLGNLQFLNQVLPQLRLASEDREDMDVDIAAAERDLARFTADLSPLQVYQLTRRREGELDTPTKWLSDRWSFEMRKLAGRR